MPSSPKWASFPPLSLAFVTEGLLDEEDEVASREVLVKQPFWEGLGDERGEVLSERLLQAE